MKEEFKKASFGGNKFYFKTKENENYLEDCGKTSAPLTHEGEVIGEVNIVTGKGTLNENGQKVWKERYGEGKPFSCDIELIRLI